MNLQDFNHFKKQIPTQAGVYKFFNKEQKIIYIGKAKNLLNRISSYFQQHDASRKTRELVYHIAFIEFTIVNTEQDALILENQLIKEYQPKYNVRLKDAKSYPYIVIKKEFFPRIFFTRKKRENPTDEYIGPFASVTNAYTIYDHIKENIPLRTCNLNLTPKNIAAKKFSVCLEYHLGKCLGPCVGFQSTENYNEGIQQIKHLLKGNLKPLILYLKKNMLTYASIEEFEKAAIIKQKITKLESYQANSIVHTHFNHNFDVIAIASNENTAYACYLVLIDGKVVQTHIIPLEVPPDASAEELYETTIQYILQSFKTEAAELVLPIKIDNYYPFKLTQPHLGDKKKLIELALKNAQFALKENTHKDRLINPLIKQEDQDLNTVLLAIQTLLKLKNIPNIIECFDNSNLQGSSAVGAMVCFKNGLPFKSEYRKFHIRTVKGINDFASMKEIVFRRYRNLVTNGKQLPDLIIIDGGKGQLSSAVESLKGLGLENKIDIVGLAKREEELFFPDSSESIKLDFGSPALNMIRKIRDEVHRYGLQFHRKSHIKNITK
ncbi:MAG: excinuclease ABC subunit UvrC [Sediminibacterium sp.]|nr:excinuclease ABC subunit UvrC [Sediminibacterium sp.]